MVSALFQSLVTIHALYVGVRVCESGRSVCESPIVCVPVNVQYVSELCVCVRLAFLSVQLKVDLIKG